MTNCFIVRLICEEIEDMQLNTTKFRTIHKRDKMK